MNGSTQPGHGPIRFLPTDNLSVSRNWEVGEDLGGPVSAINRAIRRHAHIPPKGMNIFSASHGLFPVKQLCRPRLWTISFPKQVAAVPWASTCRTWRFLKIRGTFLGVPIIRFYNSLRSISGSPHLRKLQNFITKPLAKLGNYHAREQRIPHQGWANSKTPKPVIRPSPYTSNRTLFGVMSTGAAIRYRNIRFTAHITQ